MVDDRQGLKAEYSGDGVHPNEAGYEVMESLAGPVITQVLLPRQAGAGASVSGKPSVPDHACASAAVAQ